MLTIMVSPDILTNVPSERNKFKANWLGGLAQLGERLTGSQEVRGSIPLVSTIAFFDLAFAGSFFVSDDCTLKPGRIRSGQTRWMLGAR